MLRRSLLATLAFSLIVPATALASEAGAEGGSEENVTAVMMILIAALIALGLIIVAIESKRSK